MRHWIPAPCLRRDMLRRNDGKKMTTDWRKEDDRMIGNAARFGKALD